MFKCDQCKKTSNPGTKQHKVVVISRSKQYSNTILDYKGNPKKDKLGNILTKTSSGEEIVKEINVCESCIS